MRKAGYDIASGEADLVVHRMSDDNDARRLWRKPCLKTEGILEAQVTYASGARPDIRYIPTVISQSEIRQANAVAGFEGRRVWKARPKMPKGRPAQAEISHRRDSC